MAREVMMIGMMVEYRRLVIGNGGMKRRLLISRSGRAVGGELEMFPTCIYHR